MPHITYSNTLAVADFTALRAAAGWAAIPRHQAQASLDGSALVIAAKHGESTVGMARIVSDGGYVAYIGDVIVHPAYQGQGIGKAMVNRLMEHLRDRMQPGEKTFVCLMAAKDRELFYEPYGFEARPTEDQGAGMSLWLTP